MDFVKKNNVAIEGNSISQQLHVFYGTPISENPTAHGIKPLPITKPAYQSSISIYLKQQSKKRLSTAALETLSIIAYKQPVTKAEIEQIRGVNCDYSVQKLLEKNLVEIRGKADTIGRPLIYGTSDKFMDYFGINDLSELPTPKDIGQQENEIGEERDT